MSDEGDNPLDEAALQAAVDAAATAEANEVNIRARAEAALADLQTVLDTDNAVLNLAKPAQTLKLFARALRLLIRLQLRKFDRID